ncbi:MAG: ABC transporter permease, partial [Chloroflexi bacterium]|nr:ABC transporter permease [Chloroflexota bacterium]
MQQNKTEFIRIIWAIAAKDIADALKNKRTLSTIVMVVFLMLLYRWIPVLWEGERTEIVVYDPGGSRLTPALEAAPGFRPRLVASRDEFEMYFNDGDEGPLGLVVPADFEETLARGEQPTLAGYVLWDRRFSSAALAADYEQRLSALIGQPIAIQIEGTVYPEPASMGAVRMIALMLLIAPLFIGMLTVPHLLLE